MWSTLKVSDSSGSSSPSLVSYSPRITEILLSLARWTQWAAVAMYQWLSSTPPHWGELEDEERNKEKYCVSGEISQRSLVETGEQRLNIYIVLLCLSTGITFIVILG